jgi:hypothetical protein
VATARQLARKVAAEIAAARDCGVVRCGVSEHASPTVAELATEFRLAPALASYKEIEAAAALRLAALILHQDMAYNAVIMPAARAAELAGRFLAQFGTEGVRFYTNGTFHAGRGERLTWSGVSWDPVTAATFDTGVLILGPHCSGCLWVEDED